MFRAIDRSVHRSARGRGSAARAASRNLVLARDLAGSPPAIEERWTGGAVPNPCAAHPALPSFAVIEGKGKAIGLIERERLYCQFWRPIWFDVYNRRPIAPLVTREAMVVDGTMPIEGAKQLIAYRYPQAISSGFAIVEQERYLGIGTMTALPDPRARPSACDRVGGGAWQGRARQRGQVALPRQVRSQTTEVRGQKRVRV